MPEKSRLITRVLAILAIAGIAGGSIWVVLKLKGSLRNEEEIGVGRQFPALELLGVDPASGPSRVPTGRKSMLVFFRPDCEHCRAELARLDKICSEVAADKIDCVAISFAPEPATRSWRAGSGLRMAIAVPENRNLSSQHMDWLTAVPLIFLLDESGTIRYKRSGERGEDYDRSLLLDFINSKQ